eukprot:2872197-Pyramimonas_sp.AAC.1
MTNSAEGDDDLAMFWRQRRAGAASSTRVPEVLPYWKYHANASSASSRGPRSSCLCTAQDAGASWPADGWVTLLNV